MSFSHKCGLENQNDLRHLNSCVLGVVSEMAFENTPQLRWQVHRE